LEAHSAPKVDAEASAAATLGAWRETEPRSVRATAQREAIEEALDAARLADVAARATATAATAAASATTEAAAAANEAARAANATADAAQKVLEATQTEGTARRVLERDALVAEEAAHLAHTEAVARAQRRYDGHS
jgi:hypothetical protein